MAAPPLRAIASVCAFAAGLLLGAPARSQPETATAAPAPPAASAPSSAPAAAPASAPPAAPSPRTTPPQYADTLRVLEVWLDAQAAFDRLPALSAAVVVGQDTVWRQAWGHLDHARTLPAHSDTAYSICSISKLFTSVAVMQLWEAGKFSLDDDIGKLLPAFHIQRARPGSGPITVRSLLTHSSGLPREADASYWTGEFNFPNRQALFNSLAGQRTYMAASERWQYSNLGMAVLGELVAVASGMPYDAYVQAHILQPLQMANTLPTLPRAAWGTRLAQGFGPLQRDGSRAPLPFFDTGALGPAAGFSSTTEDLARFAAWQLRLRKRGGTELLKASTLREMGRVQWTDADGKNTWGLGFGVGRDGSVSVVGHTGVCPGYLSALSIAVNEEVAVIAMTNANDNRGLQRYTTPMRRLMLKGLNLPPAPASGPALAAYAGRYNVQPWESESVILPWGKDLVQLDLPNNDPAADMTVLRHASGDRFHELRDDGSLGAEWVFVRAATGQVSGVKVWSQIYARQPLADK